MTWQQSHINDTSHSAEYWLVFGIAKSGTVECYITGMQKNQQNLEVLECYIK